MRKMKTILMMIVLGMLFISCSNEVLVNPNVDAEDLELLYNATDTIQYIVVTDGDNKTYYNLANPDRPVPEVKVMRDTPIGALMMGFFLLIGIGIGYAIGSD
jgi:hypothetical protein